jgi:hypothetical protein
LHKTLTLEYFHIGKIINPLNVGTSRSGYQIEPCKFTDMVWIWLIPAGGPVTGRNRGFL